MARLKPVQIRLSSTQIRLLEKLSQKIGLDRTNIIRLAITKLAEAEGVRPEAEAKHHP
jgi:hypothetical protein